MKKPLTRAQMEEKERAYWERQQVTDAAIEATAEAQRPWEYWASRAITHIAIRQATLTTDDVWDRLDASGVSRPDEPRAMGAAMRHAVKMGLVELTSTVVQSARRKTAAGATHHTGPVRVYLSRTYTP